MLAALRAVEGVGDVNRFNIRRGEIPQYRVESELGMEIRAALARQVVESGWELHGLEAVTMSLEEIFLKLTTEDVDGRTTNSEEAE